MFKFSSVTLFPDLYDNFFSHSLMKKACEKKIIDFKAVSLLDYVQQGKRVDGPIAGPGKGMALRPEPFELALKDHFHLQSTFKIFLSPHGKKLDQHLAKKLYQRAVDNFNSSICFFAGRYEGFDERIEQEYADEIISIGDYVLTGGDIPAMVCIEAISRFIPGVVQQIESVEKDSFTSFYTDYPHYTDPNDWKGRKIPSVLRSGNHALIEKWRIAQARKRTIASHFEWLRGFWIPAAEKKEILSEVPSHYCALLHNDVVVDEDGKVGCSSVTSIDVHDIARSCATYGVKNYFIVTAQEAQRSILNEFFNFWHTSKGLEYNKNRHFALKNVKLKKTLDETIKCIEEKEGKKPLIVATSSLAHLKHKNMITYRDQSFVWSFNRPILFIFGTAKGLSPELMDTCDFKLVPIEGFVESFNFLSVRSAVAVILDRWLGINPENIEKCKDKV